MSTTEPTDETRKALERAWADGYSQGATPGQPRPGNPWSTPVSGIWRALTDGQRLATLLFVEQRGEELFAAPVTVGYNYADERAVGLPAEATSLGVDLTVWLGLSDRIRWDVLMSRSATVEEFDTLRSMEGLTPGIPILNLSGRRHKECEELRSAMRGFAVSSPSAPIYDDRELRAAIQEVLWNASNYPEKVQARLLGQDVTPLTDKAVAAVESVLARRSQVEPSEDEPKRCEHDWPATIRPGDACLLGCGATRSGDPAPSEDVAKLIAEADSAAAYLDAFDKTRIEQAEAPHVPDALRTKTVQGTIRALAAALRAGAAVPVETEPARVALAVSGRQSGKSARMVDQILDRANERGIEVSIIEPVETVATVEEVHALPIKTLIVSQHGERVAAWREDRDVHDGYDWVVNGNSDFRTSEELAAMLPALVFRPTREEKQ